MNDKARGKLSPGGEPWRTARPRRAEQSQQRTGEPEPGVPRETEKSWGESIQGGSFHVDKCREPAKKRGRGGGQPFDESSLVAR